MSGEDEIISESVPSEDIGSGNENEQSLHQTVISIVENVLAEKLKDFKKEINDDVQVTLETFSEFRDQNASVRTRQGMEIYSRVGNTHTKPDCTTASSKDGLSYWREIAEDELNKAKGTELKNLDGMHTVICIDTSASMKENEAWEQAKIFCTDYMAGIKEENLQKRKHYNTALVTFGKETKVQQDLTKDVKVLEQKLDGIRIGGSSPMLAGLILAKASVTVSNFRFAKIKLMPVPPRIIIISDGKATSVTDIIEDEEPSYDSTLVRQKIKEEIHAIVEEEIEVHIVYVGKPDIVFLHELQVLSGGELVPYTSGRKMAKAIIFKCILQRDKDLLSRQERKLKKREKEVTEDDNENKEGKEEDLSKKRTPLDVALKSALQLQEKLLRPPHGPSDSYSSDISDEDKDIIPMHRGFLEFLGRQSGSEEMPGDLEATLHQAQSSLLESLKALKDSVENIGEDYYKEDPEMQKYAPIGSRVKRGLDWRWGNQDKGGPGTIIGHSHDELRKYWCWVEWDADGEINAYRWNLNGKCDLSQVEEERVPSEGQILAVGSKIKPGEAFKGDKLHEEGIVIKSIDGNKVQIRWADDGSREELSFGKEGLPKEIEPVISRDSKNKTDDNENFAQAVNKRKDVHVDVCEEPSGTHKLPSLPPKCLEVYDVYENTACLKWQKPVDEMGVTIDKYIVYYGETSKPNKRTSIEENSALSCTLDDLKAGSEYEAEVKVVFDQGESLPVKSEPFTTMETDNDDSHYAGWKLTDRDAARMTSAIGENWELLGPELGVGKISIHHMKSDNKSSPLCIYKMLLHWISNDHSPTFGKLIRCLKKYPQVSIDRQVIDSMKEEFRLMEMEKQF